MKPLFAGIGFLGIVGIGVGVALAESPKPAPDVPTITVYATPTCGCCKGWMAHMQDNGFDVEVVYQDDLSGVRAEHDVPMEVAACHVGFVEGYAIEGHVPADVVLRLLREKPAVGGIAVPGMPAGSPGMEMPNGMTQPYDVYTFDATGPKSVYEHRN